MQGRERLITNILVVRFSSLGDVVLVSPVFAALKEKSPGCRITFLTKSQYAGIHRSNPHLDEIRAFDPSNQSLSSLIQWARGREFDLLVDVHRSLRSRMLSLLMRIPVEGIRQERWRRFWLVARPPLKRKLDLTPVVEKYLQAAGWIESGGSDALPVLHLTEEEKEEGQRWREQIMKGREGRLVAIFPGALHQPKEWPIFNFAELGKLLIMRGDVPVVIPSLDRPEIAGALAEQEHEIVLSEPIEGPVELAAALSAADGAVANDSGPMHVAAAVGTCTVGIFGPTSPELGFAPRGPYASHVHLGLYCSPCGKHGKRVCYRQERFCMLDIKPRDVIDTLEEQFERAESQKNLDI